ncbi:MAG: signal recognition particle-docking protein FtsY [Planctomycetota bacterium]|nr:signal recognition particle-docking protein FtsY [Planctomycetota bacterium]
MVFWRKKKTVDPVQTSADASAESAAPIVSSDRVANPTEPAATSQESIAEPTRSWWRRALSKTSDLLRTDIRDLWKSEGQIVDDEFLNQLYATLVRTDMGGTTATKIRDSISEKYRSRRIELKDVLDIIREQVGESLKSKGAALNTATTGPTVILVVGVNGSGKTTSIAKLAHRLTSEGNRVLLGAGDTFRAAAVEQLKIWSSRIGCEIVHGEHGADPGSVVFKTVQRAVAESFDICILDTAGRLQTQSNLMQQLEKIKRVIEKQIPGAPHEVLLVLDATAGQNAISQAKGFSEAAGCTGIVLAKLDGSAKGGVIVPIAEQFGLPVKFVGIGEKLEDLSVFDPDDFASGLFS